ncbi:MAG TPA: PH domain-containing protein [Acidimicrobiales bacterium]|nr:PH domain-containing protein [Acidimicrobiales bacterium]
MGYPTRLLNDGEEIVLDLKPHWMYIVPTIIVWLGVTLLCLVLWNVSGQDWMQWVTLIAFLGLGVNAAVRYSKWTTTSFTVTNDRVIFRQGMFAKSGVEIPLERIMNVNFKQSIWERIVGAGDLLIESGGKDGQSRFSDIRKPELVGKEIHEQANQYEEKPARRAAAAAGAAAASNLPPPPAPAAPSAAASGDATEQLAKLHDLLTKGAITQAEYDAKKAELLNRL